MYQFNYRGALYRRLGIKPHIRTDQTKTRFVVWQSCCSQLRMVAGDIAAPWRDEAAQARSAIAVALADAGVGTAVTMEVCYTFCGESAGNAPTIIVRARVQR